MYHHGKSHQYACLDTTQRCPPPGKRQHERGFIRPFLDNHAGSNRLIGLLINQNEAASDPVVLIAVVIKGGRGAKLHTTDLVQTKFLIVLNLMQSIDIDLVTKVSKIYMKEEENNEKVKILSNGNN